MKSLKSAQNFWQEIFFMIPIGVSIIVMLIDISNGRLINDWLGIAIFCFHITLFFCLVGQFFWKNGTLSMCLAPLLVLYSLFWFFAFFAMPMSNPKEHAYLRPVLMVCALFFVIVAITMPKKYFKENTIYTSEIVII